MTDRYRTGIPRLPKCEDVQCNLPAGHLGEHQQRIATPCKQGADSTWQAIESAPKDGTVIIGYDRSNNNADARNYVEFMRWQDGRWMDPETYTAKPTHWMPLPDPPEDREQ